MRERGPNHTCTGYILGALNKAPRSDPKVISLQPESKAQREHLVTFLTKQDGPEGPPLTCATFQ